MKDLLLIDGYNIIHSWSELKDLVSDLGYEAARARLIDMICDFSAHSNFDTIIVFDAHMKKGSRQHTEIYSPIKVIFTAESETADHFIERTMLNEDTRKRDIFVATSDALEQTIIFGRGGARLSSRELHRWVQSSKKVQQTEIDEMPNSRNTIAGSLNERTIKRLGDIVNDVRLEE